LLAINQTATKKLQNKETKDIGIGKSILATALLWMNGFFLKVAPDVWKAPNCEDTNRNPRHQTKQLKDPHGHWILDMKTGSQSGICFAEWGARISLVGPCRLQVLPIKILFQGSCTVWSCKYRKNWMKVLTSSNQNVWTIYLHSTNDPWPLCHEEPHAFILMYSDQTRSVTFSDPWLMPLPRFRIITGWLWQLVLNLPVPWMTKTSLAAVATAAGSSGPRGCCLGKEAGSAVVERWDWDWVCRARWTRSVSVLLSSLLRALQSHKLTQLLVMNHKTSSTQLSTLPCACFCVSTASGQNRFSVVRPRPQGCPHHMPRIASMAARLPLFLAASQPV